MRIVLGGGCFWCTEAALQTIENVQVTPGYSGGGADDADYYKVASGKTKHAEVVEVKYQNSDLISQILDIFFKVHDPTSLNRQGADVGPQYRSVIYYENNQQKQAAEDKIAELSQVYSKPVVTELAELKEFYAAEPEHHNYFANNPNQPYCQIVIQPKLEKIKE